MQFSSTSYFPSSLDIETQRLAFKTSYVLTGDRFQRVTVISPLSSRSKQRQCADAPTAEPQAAGRLELAAVPFDPQFRLTIRDPKANVLLWGFTEHVQWAILRGNRDKNFDEAMTRVLADVRGLAARAQVEVNGGRSQ